VVRHKTEKYAQQDGKTRPEDSGQVTRANKDQEIQARLA